MTYWQDIKNRNKVLYQIIYNSVINKKTSHSFILSTNNSYEIENEWRFIVESLISKTPFTDNIRNVDNYPDLLIIDGSKDTIKKERIVSAINNFMSATALEDDGKKILVIKSLENTNKQSLNSLLKFLEEPTKNTHIIMTTNKISAILPTIKSRSQIINLLASDSSHIFSELKDNKIKCPKIYSLIAGSFAEVDLMTNHEKNVEAVIKIVSEGINNKHTIINNVMTYITKDNYSVISKILLLFINNVAKFSIRDQHEFPSDILLRHTKSFNVNIAAEAVEKLVFAMSRNTNLTTTLPAFAIKLEEAYE